MELVDEHNLFAKFAKQGVLHRNAVRSHKEALHRLMRKHLVRRVPKKGRVYYELTSNALDHLELYREQLVKEVELRARLRSRSRVYRALLEDVRFLDTKKAEAYDFRFLGDWQLMLPVRKSQLALAKYRFYEKEGLV